MSEEIFRFKKFQITQNEWVHKVGTDGVLLGAWVNIKDAVKILDAGTGTGLIAMMLAQRSEGNINITAIESDSNAFTLAKHNVEKSSFSSLINVEQSRFQDFKSHFQFDLIVCNPPFFNNSLKAATSHRTKQRHSDELTYKEILTATTRLLHPSGRLSVVLPVEEGKVFEGLALNFGLSALRQCAVFSKSGNKQERFLLEFSFRSNLIEKSALTIMTNDGNWTEEYMNLTKDFYLKF